VSKLSRLEDEIESLQGTYDDTYDYLNKLVNTVIREHDEHHPEALTWCQHESCQLARDLCDYRGGY
jgi:hypothetical protein